MIIFASSLVNNLELNVKRTGAQAGDLLFWSGRCGTKVFTVTLPSAAPISRLLREAQPERRRFRAVQSNTINRPCLESKGGYGLGACMSTVVHQTLHRMRYEGVQSVGQHNRTSTHLAQVILQAPSHHPCLRTPDITEFAVPRQLRIQQRDDGS